MTKRKPRKRKAASTPPDVSVLMPVRDADLEKLQTSIQSVLEQDGVQVEIVICDDGSQNSDVLGGISEHPVITLVRHKEPQGIAEAQNTAAAAAKGRYFIVLGVGDWFADGALAALMTVLDANLDAVGFAYGCTQYHGLGDQLYCPPPFDRQQMFRKFHTRYAYMYHRNAWEAGSRYADYITVDGQRLGIQDRDFLMQLMVELDWNGICLPDTTVLHYAHEHGSTWDAVVKHRDQIMMEFQRRWPMSGGSY